MEDMKTLANGGQSRDQEHEPLANIGTNEDEKHEHLADGSTNKDEEHNKDSFSMHDTTKMRGTGGGGGGRARGGRAAGRGAGRGARGGWESPKNISPKKISGDKFCTEFFLSGAIFFSAAGRLNKKNSAPPRRPPGAGA